MVIAQSSHIQWAAEITYLEATKVPPHSVLYSHWSRNVEAWLSLVERFIVLLRQLSYAIKNQLGHAKPPTRDTRDRWLPCTERYY